MRMKLDLFFAPFFSGVRESTQIVLPYSERQGVIFAQCKGATWGLKYNYLSEIIPLHLSVIPSVKVYRTGFISL